MSLDDLELNINNPYIEIQEIKINKKFISYCKSNDYDFFFTSLTILNLKKYKILQLAMIIKGRTAGNSKMQIKHMCKSIYVMFNLFFQIKYKSDLKN